MLRVVGAKVVLLNQSCHIKWQVQNFCVVRLADFKILGVQDVGRSQVLVKLAPELVQGNMLLVTAGLDFDGADLFLEAHLGSKQKIDFDVVFPVCGI